MYRHVSLILVGTLAAFLWFSSVESRNKTPHEFTENDCFMCHFTLPQTGDPLPMRFTDNITNLCGRCHDMSQVISHQVDMAPTSKVAIPSDMPLDESGHMTCVTCHDVHKSYKNPLTGERTYFLRRDVLGKTFCTTCHSMDENLINIQVASTQPVQLSPPPISHKPAMDRGHAFATFQVIDPDTAIDALSYACIDCHGEPGSLQKTTIGVSSWRHATEGVGLSHPIGIDYYRATKDYKDLVPERELDRRIKLYDGKIGCCTCHNPYDPKDGNALVIGTRQSFQDLCFACHIK